MRGYVWHAMSQAPRGRAPGGCDGTRSRPRVGTHTPSKPRSGEIMQPTAQAVAGQVEKLASPGGAKEKLRHKLLRTDQSGVRYAFSSAAANASSESDRNRFRRIPRSTSASQSEAAVIHWKSADSASRFSSEPMSVFRISSGAPASIDARSRNNE